VRRCGEPMDANGVIYLCRIPLQAKSGTSEDDHVHAVCGDITHAHGSTPCTRYGDRQDEAGPMLAAVQADLVGVDVPAIPGGRTYQAMAFWLAGVIDRRGEDDGPSTTAKLAVELSKVMASLTKGAGKGEGDPFDEWSKDISTPSMD
jgi:hypothetical protein